MRTKLTSRKSRIRSFQCHSATVSSSNVRPLLVHQLDVGDTLDTEVSGFDDEILHRTQQAYKRTPNCHEVSPIDTPLLQDRQLKPEKILPKHEPRNRHCSFYLLEKTCQPNWGHFPEELFISWNWADCNFEKPGRIPCLNQASLPPAHYWGNPR